MYPVPFDYSTINLEALRRLPAFRVRPGVLISEEPGGAFDAPGYPSYFVRRVSNSSGNELRNGPYQVITDPQNSEVHYIVDDVNLRSLWVPIPMPAQNLRNPQLLSNQEQRLYHWVVWSYNHHKGSYVRPNLPDGRNIDQLLFWPFGYIPELINQGPSAIRRPANVSVDKPYRIGNFLVANLEKYEEVLRFYQVLTPENYNPVVAIRQFYPEHQPILEWILNPPSTGPQNDWWERYSDSTLVVKPAKATAYSDTPIIVPQIDLPNARFIATDTKPQTVLELMQRLRMNADVEEYMFVGPEWRREQGEKEDRIPWTATFKWQGRMFQCCFQIHRDYNKEPRPDTMLKDVLEEAQRLQNLPTFEKYAEEFGINPDSRQEERIYNYSVELVDQLKVFLADEFEHFLEME